jgi:hypothetical protein
MAHKLVDPIEHAWRRCNPKVPVPSLLEKGSAPSTTKPAAESPTRPDQTNEPLANETKQVSSGGVE